ncbi:MAG: hypothetical protein Q4A98_00805 [Comamonadaceae bacterium]|nr:hypothetical protein [Comamonadaceae bacterium]
MAMTKAQIQQRSDLKRGIGKKSFSMHRSDIALIEQLAAHMGIPQVEMVTRAVRELAQRQGLELPSDRRNS